MSHAPSLRMIQSAIEAQAKFGNVDEVALESLRQDVHRMLESFRASIVRVRAFSVQGLVSEAASVVEDFPDLARQADALAAFPRSSAVISRFWSEQIDVGTNPIELPTSEEIDLLSSCVTAATRLRGPLDALRVAALRRESLEARLLILRKLRGLDERNRMWLDQIEILEKAWVKSLGDLRDDPAASREDLERAFTAVSTREWIASVPRALKEELYARLRPLRALVAGDRYAELAAKIHDAAGLMDRGQLESLEAEWAGTFHETGRMPDESLQAVVAPAFDWLNRLVAAEAEQREFDALVDTLEQALDQQRPASEIEARLAKLRDNGRSVPEGVLQRATGWMAAQAEATRRRHRIILVGSVVAAAIVVAIGGIAIRMFTLSGEARSAATELRALVDGGDAPAAHALAEVLRAKTQLHSAEVLALLVLEETLLLEWNATRAEIRVEFDALTRLLEGEVTRAQLMVARGKLEAASKRVRLEAERTSINALNSQVADRFIRQDSADAAQVDALFATMKARLSPWPLPDRWEAGSQANLARWNDYTKVLEDLKADLDRANSEVLGADIQEGRLKEKLESIDSRLTEARSRTTELTAALADLSPATLGRRVSAESEFSARIDAVLSTHGATLQRMGLLAAFEQCQSAAPSWASIQSWRDDVRPRIEIVLNGGADSSSNSGAYEAIEGFLSSFPETPYRLAAAKLASEIDPSSADQLQTPEEVSRALADCFFANLQEVPLVTKGRFYYRRPSKSVIDPFRRAVRSLPELLKDPDQLSSILLKPGERLGGPPRASAISDEWGQLESAVTSAQPGEIGGLLLASIERLIALEANDVLFQFHAIRNALLIFKQSGNQFPASTQKEIDKWLQRGAKDWKSVLESDWLSDAYEGSRESGDRRTMAKRAIRDLPNFTALAKAAADERARGSGALAALAPIGVLLPTVDSAGDRELGGPVADGTVVLVVQESNQWRFVDVELRRNKVNANIRGLPAGPVLVFKRVRS